MTDKQRKFCDEYLIDANATRAYKAAYPHVKSEDAARACASRLLTNANIKSYIDARRMNKAPDEKEKLKAAELLGRRYGLFKADVNLEVEPVVIVNDLKE